MDNNSQPVDYFTYSFDDSDLHETWRHATKTKDCVANGRRLENAAWRRYFQQKFHLSTIDASKLNWQKDQDWLYGPIHHKEINPPPTPIQDLVSCRTGAAGTTISPSEGAFLVGSVTKNVATITNGNNSKRPNNNMMTKRRTANLAGLGRSTSNENTHTNNHPIPNNGSMMGYGTTSSSSGSSSTGRNSNGRPAAASPLLGSTFQNGGIQF